MKFELREYQKDTIHELRIGFRKGHKRQVLCLPTGAGKTVVFSTMIANALQKGTRTLVVTDRVELFDQTFRAIESTGAIRPELIAAGARNIDERHQLHVAMVETLSRRIKKLPDLKPEMIVIDEAHKGNFTKIIEAYPNAFVIGATATPVGKHFPKYYTNIVHPVDIPELVAEGYLSPCHAFQMQDDFSDLETRRGEFTESSMMMHYDKPKLYGGVVEQYRKRAEGKKTLVFNCNIEHAEKMNAEFRSQGITSEVITSKTPKADRQRILKAFSDGLIPVLNNCGILTTGYDEPSIECIIVNRATQSLPLWLQMCGRGSRIYQNKDRFTLLDFGGNHDRHGLWSEKRKWTLEEKKKKKTNGVAPVKNCEGCDAMIATSVRVCPYCGHIHEVSERELGRGDLVEVQAPAELVGKFIGELTIDELIDLQKSEKYKATFIWRVVRSKGYDAVKEYASKMQYSSGWVYRQKKDLSKSQFNDYRIK